MKKIMLGLLVVFVLMFTACSDDDDDSNSTEPEVVYAYSLDQFVPENMLADMVAHDDDDVENWNELFHFWPLATDGFNPRSRGYDDMNWTDWEQGYYIPDLDNRIKFPHMDSLGIGAFNVKYMDMVYVYRAINAVVNDTLSILCEINHMPMEQVENYDGVMENAIKLSNFVPEQIAALDSVDFIAVDGWSQTYYPDEVADGYWLVDSEKTIFPNLDLPGMKKKFKWIKSMEFYGQFQDVADFVNENLGSDTEANWSFSFPEDMSSYECIEW